jgi:hypothetical protein
MRTFPAFEDFYDAHPELFDQSAGRLIDVAIANELALAEGRVEIPPDPPLPARGDAIDWPPETFDLTAGQTGFKSQADRGTCYAFAAVAAMEAAYWRQHRISLDLSEQYAFHLNKVTELVGNYLTVTRPENNSSMWGFQGSSHILDKLARWAICDEAACPYLDDTGMNNIFGQLGIGTLTAMSTQEDLDTFEFDDRHIPLNARYQARYRIRSYAAVPDNPTPNDIERVVAAGHEVVVDIPGHCVLIVGYDRPARQYIIKDSANPGSFQTMSYDGPTISAGRYITAVEPPLPPRRDAMWLGRWQVEHDGWRGELVIRRTSSFYQAANVPTKIGNYYTVGRRYDVNGWFEDDYRICHFWIAGTESKVAPGSLTGQEFCVYLMDADPVNAAGWTDFFGTRYGVTLSRFALPPVNSEAFEIHRWVGAWDFSHDGWKGILTLQAFAPVRGRYDDGHSVFQAEGQHHFHGLTLDIFGLQRFDLLMHTHNTDIASGTTNVHGATFGVQLRRRPFVPDPIDTVVPDVFVPGVVSLPSGEAVGILAAAGYGVASHWEWTSQEPEGNVSSQQPAPGAFDLPPTTVHIWVRTLPPDPPTDPDPPIIISPFPDEPIVTDPFVI